MMIELADDQKRFDASADFCPECRFDLEHCDCDETPRLKAVTLSRPLSLGMAFVLAASMLIAFMAGFIVRGLI
jgi:hypothetical protein